MNYLLGLILLTLQITLTQQAPWCFPTCFRKKCSSKEYDKCQSSGSSNCRNVFFSKDSGSGGWGGDFPCVKTPYTYYSTGQKWQPAGVTTDILSLLPGYAIGTSSNVTLETVQLISALGTAITTNNCKKDTNNDYNYFGDFPNSDTVTIRHPGVTDAVYFYQVRLIAGFIFFDDWDWSSTVTITFVSNASTTPYTTKFSGGTNSDETNDICKSSFKQDYMVLTPSFAFSTPSVSIDFQVTTDNIIPANTNIWGVMNIIIQIRLCHPYCKVCTGDSNINVCTVCNYLDEGAKLSGTTCDVNCLIGYGDVTATPDVCVQCVANCAYCLDLGTNCVNCKNNYYLYYNGPSDYSCLWNCPTHFFKNQTGNDFCQICDANCLDCAGPPTVCTSCDTGKFLYQSVCYNPCPPEMYPDTPTSTCKLCDNFCSVCAVTSTNCTACDVGGTYKSYLLGYTCTTQCGAGYWENDKGGVGPNTCDTCDSKCVTCATSATDCLQCNPTFYLLNNVCDSTCPFPDYFPDDATKKCLDCDSFCVNVTMNVYFKNNLKQEIICDLTFTEALSWGPDEIRNFIIITTDDPLISLSAFNIVCTPLTTRIMRLTISPKGYTFIYNVTFTFKTIALDPSNYHYATNRYRFSDSNYGISQSIIWFLIKAPSLSETQKDIIDGVSSISNSVQKFTTAPYVQEIKKAGVFALLFGGAQDTSTACLVNSIPSQNFYEGVRFWASFVFFDVPPWEENSNKSKHVVVPSVEDLIRNARLLEEHGNRTLFDTNSIAWRFQRTGFTSFFIFDFYINIFLILVCWIMLMIAHCCIKHKIQYNRFMGYFYAITLKVHEVTIFYISLTTLMQWIYFDAASLQRWLSLGFCILFNIYFFCYQLYIYYDMINYPAAHIGNAKYEYYEVRYGSLLKFIRFVQYDPHEPWSMKQWFRPYNYPIMSYYKRFMMMIALPIFYGTRNAQVCVLMIIQLLEIIRFCVVWPYVSKIRNILRLSLEICLQIFFICILIQSFEMKEVMLNDPNTLEKAVNIFYNIGWLGFVMVFVFNIGFIIFFAVDCMIGCKKSNRQLMDEARKVYYMQRLKDYEQDNEDVPLGLVNKWVKLGNLNDRKLDQLPDLNLRVQYFRVLKTNNGFEIDMKKLFEIFLNVEFNYQKENNVSAGKKLNKRISLTKNVSPAFYNLIQGLYKEHIQKMDFEYMTIKTFQKVVQSAHSPGEKIALKPEIMTQRIELQTYAGQKHVIKLEKLLPGFPISYDDLKHLM